MMNKIFYLVIIFIIPNIAMSQGYKDTLFFQFEENSVLEYLKKGELDKTHKTKTYIQNVKKNDNIDFFIEGLLFRHDKDKMQRKILSKSDLTCKELLSPKQIKAHINSIKEEYPLGYKYPNKEFPLLYIAKEKKDSIVLYEVKWQSYVE